MPINRRELQTALLRAGFEHDGGAKHDAYHLLYGGKRTPVVTLLSRGTSYRELGDPIVKQICHQIGVSKRDLVEYVNGQLTVEQFRSRIEYIRLKESPPVPETAHAVLTRYRVPGDPN